MTRRAHMASVRPPQSAEDGALTAVDRLAAPGLLGTVTTQIDERRRREAEQGVARGRLRAVVRLLDEAIDACEQDHLADLKVAGAELVRQARTAIAVATAVLEAAGQEGPTDVASRARIGARVHEVMDVVWETQDGVLDLLIPARRRLYEAVGPETPVAPTPTPVLRVLGPSPAPQGWCAYCGRRCDRQDAAGIRFCSAEHLRRARRMRVARTTTVAGVEALTTSATGA